jgi:hypothetical protein
MTEQEKQLLLKDLCVRLPYNVKVAIDFKGYLEFLPSDEDLEYTYRKNLNFILDYKKKTIEDISLEPNILYAYPCSERFQMLRGYTYELDYGVPVEFIKPYLRPMSSMTEEELNECVCQSGIKDIECTNWQDIPKEKQFEARLNHAIAVFLTDSNNVDWLNAHHFDYRGLIEKGLALEAPEGMYNI